jgi:heme-degrading monooxygenase HmoA
VLVLTRFRVPTTEGDDFLTRLRAARDSLARQQGYLGGTIGRNADDPELWVLETRWQNVGSYRRALSAYDVKRDAWSVLGAAIDEASAYEIAGDSGPELNRVEPRSTG